MIISRAIYLFLIAFLTMGSACTAQKGLDAYRIAFYNVENLFDTIPHPHKSDAEFTPTSKSQWNTERYWKKQSDLAMLIDSMSFPVILGLCEVENANVLTDLCHTIDGAYYRYIHQESPDDRGIDVALLYQPEFFRPIADRVLLVQIEIDGQPANTRDILHVTGIIPQSGDTLDIFVNHWPSRRGGLDASEPRRIAAAETLKMHVEILWSQRLQANIIIMGDFNDDPTNNSIQNHLLQAKHLKNFYTLENKAAEPFSKGLGTYNYRGTWNMLDQIIIGGPINRPNETLSFDTFTVYKKDFLLYESDRFGMTPNRTYGGPNYYGGISDHLPVYIDLK